MDGGATAYLSRVCLSPRLRGGGRADKMLDEVLRELREVREEEQQQQQQQ